MAGKEEKVEFEGEVVEALSNGKYRVVLDNGHASVGVPTLGSRTTSVASTSPASDHSTYPIHGSPITSVWTARTSAAPNADATATAAHQFVRRARSTSATNSATTHAVQRIEPRIPISAPISV